MDDSEGEDLDVQVSKEEEPDKIPNGINYIELPIEADGAIRPRVEAILRGEDDTDPGDLLVNANKDFVLKYKIINVSLKLISSKYSLGRKILPVIITNSSTIQNVLA